MRGLQIGAMARTVVGSVRSAPGRGARVRRPGRFTMFARTRSRRRAVIAAALLVAIGAGAVFYMSQGRPVVAGETVLVVASEGTTPPLDPHRMTGTIGPRNKAANFD